VLATPNCRFVINLVIGTILVDSIELANACRTLRRKNIHVKFIQS